MFGRRAPGRNDRTTPVPAIPPDTTGCPSTEMWGAILAGARRRRAPHVWQNAAPAVTSDPGPLVRAYVLPPQERTQVLAARAGEARW
ncbi:hypothetical protein I2W78_14040 [Streptomyces spinoverrucosus]|uniref:hypothetical protein n=1 Tax=Streptomyces spinoverrucosus TaxID=284043 RepID=UPI0018C41778|nr:hypothetical protein [Streptomyces spinoverrucosus]MBG0852934.1 hypothetical protein [Streptomyces spinoverrucosus]